MRPVHAAARRVVGSVSTLSADRFGAGVNDGAVIDVREASPGASLIYDVEEEDASEVW